MDSKAMELGSGTAVMPFRLNVPTLAPVVKPEKSVRSEPTSRSPVNVKEFGVTVMDVLNVSNANEPLETPR